MTITMCSRDKPRMVKKPRAGSEMCYLAHAVVGELDVSLVVEQHVVELEVAVDDAALVQEVQRERDLGRVEPRVLLRQAPLALHVEPAHNAAYSGHWYIAQSINSVSTARTVLL